MAVEDGLSEEGWVIINVHVRVKLWREGGRGGGRRRRGEVGGNLALPKVPLRARLDERHTNGAAHLINVSV